MEFWGIEVKPGKPVTCTPDDGIYFHVSQAALGELPKGGKGKDERIMVKVSVGKKTGVVIGTLVHGKCYQFPLDLIFDHEFTISHTGTSSNVYITGYKSDTVRDDDLDDSEAESDEEEVPTPVPVSGKGQVKEDSKGAKAEKAAEKVVPSQVAKAANQVQKEVTKKEEAKKDDKKKVIGGAKVEPPKDDSDDEEEDSDDDDDDDEDDDEDESDDDEMGEEFSDMDDSDEEDSSEEETPKVGDKKRPGLTGSMAAPADFKKMKTGTPSVVKSASSKHEKVSVTPTTPSTMKGQQNTKKFSGKKSPGSNNQKHRR